MAAVCRAERVVDVDVAEPGEAGAERRDRLGVGLPRRAVLQLHLALLLYVEAQVLK
jgi:hypothetical protein